MLCALIVTMVPSKPIADVCLARRQEGVYLRIDCSTNVPVMLLKKLRGGALIGLRDVAELCDGALLLGSVCWRHVGLVVCRDLVVLGIRGGCGICGDEQGG